MFCNICGREFDASAVNCSNCGISVIDVPAVESIDEKTELTADDIIKQTKKRRHIIPSIIGVIVLILLVVIEPLVAIILAFPALMSIILIYEKQKDKKNGVYLSVGICDSLKYDPESTDEVVYIYKTKNGNRIKAKILSSDLYTAFAAGDFGIALVSDSSSNNLLWVYPVKQYYTKLPFYTNVYDIVDVK